MADLGSNSYGSLAEVSVLARHLLEGEPHFNDSTEPTDDEVARIIDRISGVLNMALAARGFSIPLTNATAVLACSDWVTKTVVCEIRMAYPHLGVSNEDEAVCGDVYQSAYDFVALNEKAFQNLGETIDEATSEGLSFTGMDVYTSRSDPDNTGREQPKFRRDLFQKF